MEQVLDTYLVDNAAIVVILFLSCKPDAKWLQRLSLEQLLAIETLLGRVCSLILI